MVNGQAIEYLELLEKKPTNSKRKQPEKEKNIFEHEEEWQKKRSSFAHLQTVAQPLSMGYNRPVNIEEIEAATQKRSVFKLKIFNSSDKQCLLNERAWLNNFIMGPFIQLSIDPTAIYLVNSVVCHAILIKKETAQLNEVN